MIFMGCCPAPRDANETAAPLSSARPAAFFFLLSQVFTSSVSAGQLNGWVVPTWVVLIMWATWLTTPSVAGLLYGF